MNQVRGIWEARRYFDRLATFVLLAGIAYSVTFGTLHSHADASQVSNARPAAQFIQTAIADSRTAGNTGTDEKDCLICRFHQQLFNTAMDARLALAGATAERAHTPTRVSFDYSNQFASSPIERHSGRAPPLA